jgi:hypothetical protein
MSKELTTFMSKGRLPVVSDEQLASALTQTVDEAGGVTQAGLNFLGFSGKQGIYSLGKAKEDVEEEQLFLVEPAATIAGWTCWKASKPIGKHKWLSTDAYMRPELVVAEADLEDHGPYRANTGDGWKEMMGIGLIELVDMDTSIEYSTTAVSAINGLKDLIQEAADRLGREEPSMPIIWLGREQFTAQGSTNWKPTFNIEAWVTREAVAAFAEGRLSDEQLLAGAAPRKRAPAKKKAADKKKKR